MASNSSKNFLAGRVFPLFSVLDALTDTFRDVGLGGDVKQALVGFCVLDDSCCPPFYREYNGALAFLQLLYELARTAPEVR